MTTPGIYGYIRDGTDTTWHLTTDPAIAQPITLCGKVMGDPHRLNPMPIDGTRCVDCRAVADRGTS